MGIDSVAVAPTSELASDGETTHRCGADLSARLARLLEAIENERASDPIELLHFLGRYVSEDLVAEDAAILTSNYPAAASHLAEHESFRFAFAGLVKGFARYGNDPRVTEQLRGKVLSWLETHVRTSDRALCDYLHRVDAADA
jgi:hemerythrin-like metal-binding protein